MATMINCATDWTFDLFLADLAKVAPVPMRGVYRHHGDARLDFCQWYIDSYARFHERMTADGVLNAYNAHITHWGGVEYAGDLFRQWMDWDAFSDLYKDAYGQRPHLNKWYYITKLAPTGEDVTRTFFAHPLDDACDNAHYARTGAWLD